LFEVILLGRGGQGVVTAGRIQAEAALDTGYYAQSFPEFGPERSGAPVRTYVRISDQPLTLRAPMDQADHAIVFEARLLRTGIAGQVRGGGTLVVGSSSPLSSMVVTLISTTLTPRALLRSLVGREA